MSKEKLEKMIMLGKNSKDVKEAFLFLEDIAQMLKKDYKFKTFAQSKAKGGFVSPSEMILLAYDYINNTGKYAEYLEKKKTAVKASKPKDPKPRIDIFSLEL